MAARWLDPGEQRAWRSLMEMQDGLSEFIERQLRNRCGLSHADYQVLAFLSEAPEGRLRSFALGALLHWEKSRLSQHLGRMQHRGLVSRERCRTDQRGAVVAITGCGSDLIEAAAPQHVGDVRDVLIDHVTAAELETLVTVAGKVQDRLFTLGKGGVGSPPGCSDCRRSRHARTPRTHEPLLLALFMTRLVELRAWALATRWYGAALSLTLIADAAAAPRALPGQAERLFTAAGVTVIDVVAVAVSCTRRRRPHRYGRVSRNDHAAGPRRQTFTHSLGLAAERLSKGRH